MQNSKITLGLPVFNGEKYIHEALRSIFKQTFKNFDLIIYDNCSTDKTLSICKKYQKKNNIRIYKQKKRVKAVENYLSVLKKADSKYFLFISHDDIFKEKKYLENLIEKISNDTIPFGTINIINNKSYKVKHLSNNVVHNYVGPSIYRRLKFFLTPLITGRNNIIYGIHERKHLLNVFKFMIKAKYRKYYKYLKTNIEDNYINYMILKEKKVCFVPNVTLLKRVRREEIKKKFFNTKKNNIKIFLDIFNSLLTFTKFSNFFEAIIIFMLIPVYIVYERYLVFLFLIKK